MSDLKHQTIEELRQRKACCEKYITTLYKNLNAEKQRLIWIEFYIDQKRLEMEDAQESTYNTLKEGLAED